LPSEPRIATSSGILSHHWLPWRSRSVPHSSMSPCGAADTTQRGARGGRVRQSGCQRFALNPSSSRCGSRDSKRSTELVGSRRQQGVSRSVHDGSRNRGCLRGSYTHPSDNEISHSKDSERHHQQYRRGHSSGRRLLARATSSGVDGGVDSKIRMVFCLII
jgi:hypothetical protein